MVLEVPDDKRESVKLAMFAAAFAAIVLLLGSSPLAQPADQLVLTDKALGPLSLNRSPVVSVPYLKRIFPAHRVTHLIGSGDSPDFHYFEVIAADGERLFSIKSFIDEKNPGPTNADGLRPVRIDVLTTRSRRIVDGYGIRIGDRVADIVRNSSTTLRPRANGVQNGSRWLMRSAGTGGSFRCPGRSQRGNSRPFAVRSNPLNLPRTA